MAVRIRLRRTGAKRQPSYRLVVADARAPRDGRFIDVLGYYNPLRQPAEVVVDEEKALMWLKRGAQPTETARDLLARQGVLEKFTAAGGKVITVPEPEREVKEETYTEAPLEKLAAEAAAEEEAMAAPEPETVEEEAREEAEVLAASEGLALEEEAPSAVPAGEEEAAESQVTAEATEQSEAVEPEQAAASEAKPKRKA